MRKFNKESLPKQMPLFLMDGFDEIRRDPAPLPILVSQKWGFPLIYVDTSGKVGDYLYCARDWYIGLGGDKSNWSRLKSDWLSSVQPVAIETKRERRQPEILEYVGEKGLYDIVQAMKVTKKNAERLQPIKDYLSKSGVRFDEIRRDPAKAKAFIGQVEKHHGIRADGIVKRNIFTETLRDTHMSRNPEYWTATNVVYHKLFRTAKESTAKKEICAILGLDDKQAKNFRDHVNGLALSAIAMAEEASAAKMRGLQRSLSTQEQLDIVRYCAREVAIAASHLAEYANVDLLTGAPLLKQGNY
jgi:hypothetical protein